MSKRRGQSWIALALLLAAGAVLLAWQAAAAPATARAKPAPAPNPHWKADGCVTCHAVSDGRPQPIDPAKTDALCMTCHDGEKAKADPHPIGVPPANEKSTPPKGWPMLDGKLVCLTCHDAKAACDQTLGRPLRNPHFLRGPVARTVTREFCAHCHEAAPYRQLNPHVVLDEQNQVITAKCLVCHDRVLDRNAMTRTGEPALNPVSGSASDQCRTCHAQHKDYFTPGHMGAKLSPKVQAFLVARETTGLMSRPAREMLDHLEAEKAQPRLLVADRDGRITCTTCHNPHQAGLFPPGSVLSYRAMRVVDQGKLRSPVRGQHWCQHCHDM